MHLPSLLLEAFSDFIVKHLSFKKSPPPLPLFSLMLSNICNLSMGKLFSPVTQYLKEKI